MFQAKPRFARVLASIVISFAAASLLFGAWGMTRVLAQSWYGRAEIPVVLSATFLGNEDVGSGAAGEIARSLGG